MNKIRQAIIKHLWWIIAISGVALLICHSFQIATVTVDTTTLVLLVLILLSPFVAAIKRIKFGEFEAEIDSEEVRRVTGEVARQVPELETTDALTTAEEHPAIVAIRELAKTDSVIALAKLRIELESTLRRLRNRSRGGQLSSPTTPLHHIIRDLAADEVLPHQLVPSIRDVLALCNRAIHGEAIREEDARSVIEAGTELLQAFERLLNEYGVAHPIDETVITHTEIDAYQEAQYRVVTIIPLVDAPKRMTYILTREELENYFDGYAEFAEFVVSIERIDPNAVS